MSITAFIRDEVERQGFERGTAAFIERCEWMHQAWGWAQGMHETRPFDPSITPELIKRLGTMIERHQNAGGWRVQPVMIAGFPVKSIGCDYRLIEERIVKLCAAQESMTPDEFYLEFERIHPFADGNGRVGKILHNWLNGTLDNPVLVKDYFGHGAP